MKNQKRSESYRRWAERNRARLAAYQRERRRNRIVRGQCLRCPEKARHDSAYCDLHHEMNKGYKRDWASKQRAELRLKEAA